MNDIEKAAKLLENEFGSNWKFIAQMLGTQDLRKRVGKELTSLMAFPQRGDGGSSAWRGNCSPQVVYAIAKYVIDSKKYYGKNTDSFTLLDPMSGSGSSKAAADKLDIAAVLYDLNPTPNQGLGNWNALKDDVKDSADLIFFHPPYDGVIKYSGDVWGSKPHPDDLSRCENYKDFLEKLNFVIKKLYMALRKDGRLAILAGDIRSNGVFRSMQHDILKIGEFESFMVKSQFNCVSDNRTYKKPFIPIVTEYILLFHKSEVFTIAFSRRVSNTVDIRQLNDTTLTWHHLVRMTMESMGGNAKLSDLYSALESHPKAQRNSNFKKRIRATIYEHKDQYLNHGNGYYELNYKVA